MTYTHNCEDCGNEWMSEVVKEDCPDCIIKDLFILTPEQDKAFKALKVAFKKCKKAGLFMYNNYGQLGVADENRISEYNDTPSPFADGYTAHNPNEFQLPCNEWADDPHYFHASSTKRR